MPSSNAATRKAGIIAEGLAFGESPRWHDGRLWLCNWGTGQIVAVGEEGACEVMLTTGAVLPYSIDWLPDGRLLVISGREGILLRRETDGTLVTHADLRGLSQNPWNEIVVDGRGNIYVNGGGPAAGGRRSRAGHRWRSHDGRRGRGPFAPAAQDVACRKYAKDRGTRTSP